MEWIGADEAAQVSLFPRVVRDNLPALLEYGETLYLGSERRGG